MPLKRPAKVKVYKEDERRRLLKKFRDLDPATLAAHFSVSLRTILADIDAIAQSKTPAP